MEFFASTEAERLRVEQTLGTYVTSCTQKIQGSNDFFDFFYQFQTIDLRFCVSVCVFSSSGIGYVSLIEVHHTICMHIDVIVFYFTLFIFFCCLLLPSLANSI